jgi:hypothetical protein
MAKEERLFVDDEIRDESSTQWVSAGTVSGLFPEAADEDDLSSMLSDGDMPAAAEDRADSDDLCFCRTRTEELGPMPFAHLLTLARTGRLGRRDQIRIGTRGEWVEARSVAGLFEEPVKPAPQSSAVTAEMQAAASMLDTMEIVADQTPKKTRVSRVAPEPLHKIVDEGRTIEDDVSPVGVSDEEAMWHCRVMGQEVGPVGWSDMRELVELRQLGPNDRVRKGQSVAWVPAATIDNLFPKRKKQRLTKKKKEKISEEDVLDILQPEEQEEEEEVSSHLAPQRSFVAKKSSAASVPVRPARASEPAAEARPAPVAPSPPMHTQAAAAPAPRPLPPTRTREKKSFSNPLAGLGGRLADMGGGLASMGKPAAIAVGVLVLGAAIYFGAPALGLGTSPSREIYDATASMWSKAQSFRKAKSQESWDPFRKRFQMRVLQYTVELKKNQGDALTDALLTCYEDCLPKILDAPITEANAEWTKMEECMKKADDIAN